MKEIIDFLNNLGLSESEVKIYVKLLELGRCSITELAHSLSMNRVTAHFNVQSLIDMGLIAHVKQGRSRELTAQSPEALKYLVEQKDKQLRQLHEQYVGALPQLIRMMPRAGYGYKKPDVKFYQGVTGARAIYHEALTSKELRSYVNVSRIFDIFPENARLFAEAVHLKNLTLWEIVEDSAISRADIKNNDPERYYYKFFPKDWKGTNVFDYMIFDGKIAIIAGKKAINGILIVNEDMYQNALSMFELLWKLLPEPTSF